MNAPVWAGCSGHQKNDEAKDELAQGRVERGIVCFGVGRKIARFGHWLARSAMYTTRGTMDWVLSGKPSTHAQSRREAAGVRARHHRWTAMDASRSD